MPEGRHREVRRIIFYLFGGKWFLLILTSCPLSFGTGIFYDSDLLCVLQLGHYLFVHSKVVSQNCVEAFRALEEARTEVEKARAEADALKVA